jgi:hypothetical protein
MAKHSDFDDAGNAINQKITAEEFERQYCERSGITVEELHSMGHGVVPCNEGCDWDECEGWGIVNLEQHAEDQRFREKARA